MDEFESLSHTKWECKYHVVFIPKFRRKALYGQLRDHLGELLRKLATQKESRIEEGHLMPDHVHMMISIPPKYAVSQVIGYVKGKSAIHLARVYGERRRNFVGQHFWARGYFVSTVGRDEAFPEVHRDHRFCEPPSTRKVKSRWTSLRFKSHKLGIRVSRRVHPEVPPQGAIRATAGSSWRIASQVSNSKGKSDRRRAFDAGSCAHHHFDPTEIRGFSGDRICQGQECDPSGPRLRGTAAQFCRATFLGARIFRLDRGEGRSCDPGIHQEPGKGRSEAGATEPLALIGHHQVAQ